MTIQFIHNRFPLKDKELMNFFKEHRDAFNLGDPNEIPNFSVDNEFPDFFDVLENGTRVGFVFFTLGDSKDIEISLGKINNNCEGLLDKVLSKLDEIKSSLQIDCIGNYTHWSAVVKHSNKKSAYIIECLNGKAFDFLMDSGDGKIFTKPIK